MLVKCDQTFTSNSSLDAHKSSCQNENNQNDFKIRVEEVLIKYEPNELQSQQDNSRQCSDSDERFVLPNSTEIHQIHSNTGS